MPLYAPWRVIENSESFMVEDEAKHQLAFIYFSDDIGRAHSMHRISREEARKLAQSIAAMPEQQKADSDRFWDWVAMFHGRIESVTGISVNTLFPFPADLGEGEEGFASYRGQVAELWKIYKTGVDAVIAADEDLKGYPSDQKPGDGHQSADDFRREWLEAQARMNALAS